MTDANDYEVAMFHNLLQTSTVDNREVYLKLKNNREKLFGPDSAVFKGSDELLWGSFFIFITIDRATKIKSATIVDKLGLSFVEPIDVSEEGQFYPAIENLDPKDQSSELRQCIAVALLQRYSELSGEQILKLKSPVPNHEYDQIHAGELASRCKKLDSNKSQLTKDFKNNLEALGLLQSRKMTSALLDVVYTNTESTIDMNNRLVYHLGEQLEQLFNPLTEYSPEQTEYTYKEPEYEPSDKGDAILVQSICNELLQFQIKFALNLVDFLQKFLIPLRVQVLNEKIEGLSTVKLNRLFPPTIDEVTRINCIFLDSLKAATPYGSFEVLKACAVTISYFYKAYTRHEAATKNFSKDIKLFMKSFGNEIPSLDEYNEMKIETIIKGPQEKIMKLKLILDRLFDTKKWPSELQEEAKKNYDNVVETIHSFGSLAEPINSYSTRVFTPSGKILTELAKAWPVELQYKWLKRRVIGVFDIENALDSDDKGLLIIFSDYVVFLKIEEAKKYYSDSKTKKPYLADVFMNSLINEVPLPTKIPKLTVNKYCYIDQICVTTFGSEVLRFDAYNGEDTFTISCKLSSKTSNVTAIADLIVKATILEKDSAFHLFKASKNNFSLYSTAHTLEAYQEEKLRSKYAMFLNAKPEETALEKYKIHTAIFANLVEEDGSEKVFITIFTIDNRHIKKKLLPGNLVAVLLEQLSHEIPTIYSSLNSKIFTSLITVNRNIVETIQSVVIAENVAKPEPDVKKSPKLFPAVKLSPEKAMPNSGSAEQKSSNKKSFENENQKHHSKNASYATITTFRSYKSDLKEASPKKTVASPKPTKDQPSQKQSQTMTAKSPKKVPQTKPVKKSTEKRKSVTDVFKSFFGGKKKKQAKSSNSDGQAETKKISKPISKPFINSNSKSSSIPNSKSATKSAIDLDYKNNQNKIQSNSTKDTSLLKSNFSAVMGASEEKTEPQPALAGEILTESSVSTRSETSSSSDSSSSSANSSSANSSSASSTYSVSEKKEKAQLPTESDAKTDNQRVSSVIHNTNFNSESLKGNLVTEDTNNIDVPKAEKEEKNIGTAVVIPEPEKINTTSPTPKPEVIDAASPKHDSNVNNASSPTATSNVINPALPKVVQSKAIDVEPPMAKLNEANDSSLKPDSKLTNPVSPPRKQKAIYKSLFAPISKGNDTDKIGKTLKKGSKASKKAFKKETSTPKVSPKKSSHNNYNTMKHGKKDKHKKEVVNKPAHESKKSSDKIATSSQSNKEAKKEDQTSMPKKKKHSTEDTDENVLKESNQIDARMNEKNDGETIEQKLARTLLKGRKVSRGLIKTKQPEDRMNNEDGKPEVKDVIDPVQLQSEKTKETISSSPKKIFGEKAAHDRSFDDDPFNNYELKLASTEDGEPSASSSIENDINNNDKKAEAHDLTAEKIDNIEIEEKTMDTKRETINDEKSAAKEFDEKRIDQKNIKVDEGLKDKVEKAAPKIFPIIEQIERKKIDFVRSPSYIELFDITRLVFDEVDAQYNWKKLSNPEPLKKSVVRKISGESKEKTKRRRSLRISGDFSSQPPPLSKVPELTESVSLSPEKNASNSSKSSESEHSKTKNQFVGNTNNNNSKSPKKMNLQNEAVSGSADVTGSTDILNEIKDTVDNALNTDSTEIRNNARKKSANRRSGMFKVVNKSSSKIVNKELDEKENKNRSKIIQPTASSILPPPVSNSEHGNIDRDVENVRKPKLQKTSKSDTGTETSLKPLDGKPDAITTTDEQTQVDNKLLDDMDFGSFNMTFNDFDDSVDMSDSANESSKTFKRKTLIDSNSKTDLQPPIYYKISNSVRSGLSNQLLKNSEQIDDASKTDKEEIIWYSPNKLDAYNNKSVSAKTNGTPTKKKSVVSALKKSESSTLPRELSYAYLANIIDDPHHE